MYKKSDKAREISKRKRNDLKQILHSRPTTKTKCKHRPEFICQISHYFRFLWNSQLNLKKKSSFIFDNSNTKDDLIAYISSPDPPLKNISLCSGTCPQK